MKTQSCATKQNFLQNSLKLTAIFLFGAVQICESSLAQPTSLKTNPINNTAAYRYIEPVTGLTFSGTASSPLQIQALIDPFGRVTACDGSLLPDYTGFSVGLYELLNSTGDFGAPILLTGTVPPSQASASRQTGLPPNFFNSNPFFLTNTDLGRYNFLLDVNRGQVEAGREYVLVVKAPANSLLGGRRIRITITSRVGDIVNYTATSLDGNPISASNGAFSINGKLDITDAATVGLSLAVLNIQVGVCEAEAIQLSKTGDRAAAQPGDIVVYRLSARNLSTTVINRPKITDELPLGFKYVEGSVRAEFDGNPVAVQIEQSGNSLTFYLNLAFPNAGGNRALNIVYAAELTNDAVRGTGINRASMSGIRADNNQAVRIGPVSHSLRIRPGILSDCGTLIGRVFVDKNFDGEQQPGELGIPNAVIYMDDGNRIVTDANGLYSLSSVLSGSRTLALDLTSVPGYTLAPNLYFIERNSQSRLVRLAPGGLQRANFAVTPAARGVSGNQQGGAK